MAKKNSMTKAKISFSLTTATSVAAFCTVAGTVASCAAPLVDSQAPKTSPANTQLSYLPSFPGAQGAGAKATGGRRGRVIAVTNLNDAGEGSLRAALEASGARIVVFRMSGTISLQSKITVRSGDLTIAGQSAPGDGICLKNYGLIISASNVVVRHLRARLGDEGTGESDCITVWRGSSNVIIDHCSASWSIDEALSLAGEVSDVTVQWCLIAEALHKSKHAKGNHGYGSLMRASGPVSLHHNLWAHNDARNPRLGDSYGKGPFPTFDVRNNVIYDYGATASGLTQGNFSANYVANYLRPGPNSTAKAPITIGGPSQIRFYLNGNEWEGHPDFTLKNAKFPNKMEIDGEKQVELLDAPVAMEPVTTTTAAQAWQQVLDGAGATLPKRDAVDSRIVRAAREGTGRLLDSQNEVGGWPALASAPAPSDGDGDGMPDSWERARGLKPQDGTDGALDKDGDGYTNVEEWLNSTDASVATDYRALKNNVDSISGAGNMLQKDVVYGQVGAEKLRLDAFTPAGIGPFPTAIVIHGGGWSGGDKADDTMPICDALGSAGFAWFAINYRLAPANRWPAASNDVQSALRWVKNNAVSYRANPNRIALIGYSAGGHLAVQVATQPGAPKVQAVIAVAAPVDLVADTKTRGELSPSLQALFGAPSATPDVLKKLALASPLNAIRAGLPPFLLLHGTADKSVSYSQSTNLRAKLAAHGVPSAMITLPGAPHRLADWPQFDAAYAQKMTKWLHKTLGTAQI